jgi:flavin reductase (DIM6/NTAB) family NADH-FMN oxidoreductase RutF
MVQKADHVGASLIAERHANFERRLYDDVMVAKYNCFFFEVVKAHVAVSPKYPETMHYTATTCLFGPARSSAA